MAANAGGIRAGKAFVEAYLNADPLIRGLKALEGKLKAFGKSVAQFGAGISGLGAAIGTPLLASAKLFADTGSALNDMAARTGLSVEALSQLGHAAEQTGSDMEAVEGAARKLQKNIAGAALGSDQARDAFSRLGLDWRRLARLNPDQQFEAVAKAVGRVKDATMRAGAAMDVFGRGATAILPLIADFDALTQEAIDLGLVMSTEDAAAADALGDSLDNLRAMVKRASILVGSALAPALTEVIGHLITGAKVGLDWIDANRGMVVAAGVAAVALTTLGGAVTGLGFALIFTGAAVGTIATALGALLSPIGLVATALVAGAGVWAFYTQSGQAALVETAAAFTGFKDVATSTMKGVADALKGGDVKLAAQVLWAGLRVEWMKGSVALQTLWADWGVGFVDTLVGVKFDALRVWTELSSGMEIMWVETMGKLQAAINGFIEGAAKALADSGLPGFAAKYGAGAIAGAAKGVLGGASGGLLGGVPGTGAPGMSVAEREAAAHDARNRRDVALADLAARQQADTTDRKMNAMQGAQGASAALGQAEAELKQLQQYAKDAADKGPKKPKEKGPPELAPERLDEALAQTKAKVDVRGTFDAAALGGLGAGDTGREQVDEQKKSNALLNKINDRMRNIEPMEVT